MSETNIGTVQTVDQIFSSVFPAEECFEHPFTEPEADQEIETAIPSPQLEAEFQTEDATVENVPELENSALAEIPVEPLQVPEDLKPADSNAQSTLVFNKCTFNLNFRK